MQIHTTARHFELTPGLRRHIEDRLGRCERVLDRPVEARVVLAVQKYRHRAEIALRVPRGEVVGKGESPDMYASVDLAAEKVLRQLIRLKERASARARRRGPREARGGRTARSAVLPQRAAVRSVAAAAAVPLATEHQAVERITVAEALARVGDGGSDCLVFRDAAGGGLRVLYRRRDGRFGLVEPEAAGGPAPRGAARPGARAR